MNSLLTLVDNSRTDKNTLHSYLGTYFYLFESIKETAKHVLEIGIYKGGSIRLWHDYFTSAMIYGVDISPLKDMAEDIQGQERIYIYPSTDGYQPGFVSTHFKSKGIQFDVIIDDGPHTLDSMIQCIQLYLPLLSEHGILIIEDIQDFKWINELHKFVPDELKPFIRVHDLRANKNRYDDILFVIDKSKSSF